MPFDPSIPPPPPVTMPAERHTHIQRFGVNQLASSRIPWNLTALKHWSEGKKERWSYLASLAQYVAANADTIIHAHVAVEMIRASGEVSDGWNPGFELTDCNVPAGCLAGVERLFQRIFSLRMGDTAVLVETSHCINAVYTRLMPLFANTCVQPGTDNNMPVVCSKNDVVVFFLHYMRGFNTARSDCLDLLVDWLDPEDGEEYALQKALRALRRLLFVDKSVYFSQTYIKEGFFRSRECKKPITTSAPSLCEMVKKSLLLAHSNLEADALGGSSILFLVSIIFEPGKLGQMSDWLDKHDRELKLGMLLREHLRAACFSGVLPPFQCLLDEILSTSIVSDFRYVKWHKKTHNQYQRPLEVKGHTPKNKPKHHTATTRAARLVLRSQITNATLGYQEKVRREKQCYPAVNRMFWL